MSECKGAFGAFDQQNMAGAVAAMSQFAGATPVQTIREGLDGRRHRRPPAQARRRGLRRDTADTAIKETRRIMEQLMPTS